VAVCLRDPHHYSAAHPGPEHVVLLVEVADTSLAYDRGRKAGAYARAGIPALWIVDLGGQCIEAFSEPDRDRGRYLRQERLTEGAPLLLPNGEAIRTSDLLPPA
jgi:Uma2 family endonuclease